MSDLPTHEGHGRRQPQLTGEEYDTFTKWRYLLARFNRAGESKKVKRGYNRRARARERQLLRRMRYE